MRFIAGWIAAGCLLGVWAGGVRAEAPPDPAAVVRTLVADINAGHVDAAAALFTADATWTDGPAEVLPPGQAARAAGRAEIAALLAASAAGHAQLTLLEPPAVSGDQVHLRMRLTEDALALAGLSGVDLDTIAAVRGGLIASVANTVTPASVARIQGVPPTLGKPLPKTGADPLASLLGAVLVALGAGLALRGRLRPGVR